MDESDVEYCIPAVSIATESDEDIEINDSQNQTECVDCDVLQWKECVSGSETSRLAVRNILREYSDLTNYLKINVRNNSILSASLLFLDSSFRTCNGMHKHRS